MSIKIFTFVDALSFSFNDYEVDMSFLFVALGGALGAVARYATSLIPVKTEFPVLTLITNIMGAVLIGFMVGCFGAYFGIPWQTNNTFTTVILRMTE